MKNAFTFPAYLHKAVTVAGEKLFCVTPHPQSIQHVHESVAAYVPGEKVYVTIGPYTQEDTTQINRYFHKVLRYFFTSGQSSYVDIEQMKDEMMRKYGKGIISYLYWNGERLVRVKTRASIPEGSETYGMVGSWSDYTRQEMYDTVRGMIAEMKEAGVSGKEFDRLIGEGDNSC